MGTQIGCFVQTLSLPLVIVFCVLIGFVITFTEPSVVVLSRQVQEATKGNISSIVVLISICFLVKDCFLQDWYLSALAL